MTFVLFQSLITNTNVKETSLTAHEPLVQPNLASKPLCTRLTLTWSDQGSLLAQPHISHSRVSDVPILKRIKLAQQLSNKITVPPLWTKATLSFYILIVWQWETGVHGLLQCLSVQPLCPLLCQGLAAPDLLPQAHIQSSTFSSHCNCTLSHLHWIRSSTPVTMII